MADLFEIDGATIDPSLIGLSEDWIERFLHVDRESVLGHH